jgi:hypothetical protein
MCDKCLETKATETHQDSWNLNSTVNLCTFCAIESGFRTVDWYKDNEDMIMQKYGIDWREI